VGLAAIEDGADLDALWDAASLEEDWQAELWARMPKRRPAATAVRRFCRRTLCRSGADDGNRLT
jgi:chaperone required for assembly of F1-ATPase